jgi:signal transduction histidine kinase/CheY-like chemotaxis protein/HPt (histidine-containing phosphotransfer) domain-containing protein
MLILANWRLMQVERILPQPPPGLKWVRILSLITLVNMLVWGLAYSGLEDAYSRLIYQLSCLTMSLCLPAAFEVFFGLLWRKVSASARVSFWTICGLGGLTTAALGVGPSVHRHLPSFHAHYTVTLVADWVLYGSLVTIAILCFFAFSVLRTFEPEEGLIVRPMAFGALFYATTLAHDQINTRALLDTPYLAIWGIWVWVMSFALACERLARQRINELRSRSTVAEARTGARSAFLANMSHELRTPLGGLLGLTDLLMADERLSPRQVRLAHALQGSANRLHQLIDEVLDLETLELGRDALKPKPFSIETWMVQLQERAEALQPSDDVSIVVEALPINLLQSALVGDSDRLAKALLNLVANALRHTRRGEVSLALRLRQIDKGEADLRFVVRDTGSRIGRPDRNLSATLRNDRLSDQMADDPNLSLALALRLTELVGGRLNLQTTTGLGSTYTLSIRLPFIPADELPRDLRNNTSRPKDSQKTRSLEGLTLLVVDDHPVNRLILAMPLEQAGALVHTAAGGLDGLNLMEEHAFDLVLMDLHMPKMDGAAATRELRSREAEGRLAHAGILPVVPVSADVTERARNACHEAGMLHFIPKPYNRGLLIETIAEVLQIETRPEAPNPRAPSSTDDVPFAAILAMVDGHNALAAEVLQEHVERTPELLEALDAAFESRDFDTIRRHAHTLKGSLLTLGFSKAGETARALEEHARVGHSAATGETISDLHRKLVLVDAAIKAFLEEPSQEKRNV